MFISISLAFRIILIFSGNVGAGEPVTIRDTNGTTITTNTDSDAYKNYIASQKPDKGNNAVINDTIQIPWEKNSYYTGGTHTMSDKYLQKNNGEALRTVSAAAGQISSTAGGQTKNPKTAAIASASGSFIGAGGMMLGATHYGNRATQYWEAYGKNKMTAQKNKPTLGQIDGLIAAAAAQNKQDEVTRLQALKTQVEAHITEQTDTSDTYFKEALANLGMSAVNLVGSAALGYTGYLQLQQGKKLDRVGGPPKPDGNRKPGPEDNSPPKPNIGDKGWNPKDIQPSKQPNSNASSGGNDLLQPDRSGASDGDGGALKFLSPSSYSGDSSPEEKGEGDPELSEDQSYGSGGGGGLGLFGGYSPDLAPSMGFSGFDMSQFLPANLRDADSDEYLSKEAHAKDEEKNSIILGKDSPSLFTRITKAHQRKAHEMSKGVL